MKRVWIKGCLPAPELTPLPSDEIWGINRQAKHPPERPTRWFDLHGLGHTFERYGPNQFRFLSELECPVYLFQGQIDRWDRFCVDHGMLDMPLPREVRPFPVAETTSETVGGGYKTNTFDWLFALAMLEFNDIHLVGVDYSADIEQLWDSRRKAADWIAGLSNKWAAPAPPAHHTGGTATGPPAREVSQVVDDLRGINAGDESWAIASIQYYIGLARGQGIRVTVPEGAGFFRLPHGGLYGLDPTVGGQ